MYPQSWTEQDPARGGRSSGVPAGRPLPPQPPEHGRQSPYQRGQSPYQQMRPRNSYEVRDHASSQTNLMNPAFSGAQQNSPGLRRGHRPQRHSPLPYQPSPEPYQQYNAPTSPLSQLPNQPNEQQGDMAKLFAPFRSFGGYTDPEHGAQHQRSPDGSKDSSSDSQTSSRRGSWVQDGPYGDTARDDPGWGQDYKSGGQGSGPESIPGTPLAPPTPTWMYNSSPVASSLHLPFSGYTNSPGAASMSSLSSAPYVSYLPPSASSRQLIIFAAE